MSYHYVYCIAEKPGVVGIMGIGGNPVQVLEWEGLSLVYSHLDKEVPRIEENYFVHENVLEELMRRGATILPFRFGTRIAEGNGSTLLRDRYGLFLEKIRHLDGKVEVGVRALWNRDDVQERLKRTISARRIDVSDEKIRLYLERKMEAHLLNERVLKHATQEAEALHARIMDEEIEGTYLLMKTESMFFNASYLVKKKHLEGFDEKVQRISRTSGEYKFLVTGPWPPYNFCNLSIE
jgi:hypothetical protein